MTGEPSNASSMSLVTTTWLEMLKRMKPRQPPRNLERVRGRSPHEVTMPHALDEWENDGHGTDFDKAAGKLNGPLKGHHGFDSDLPKALEGAVQPISRRALRPESAPARRPWPAPA